MTFHQKIFAPKTWYNNTKQKVENGAIYYDGKISAMTTETNENKMKVMMTHALISIC